MQTYKELFEASFARVSAPQLDQEFFATFYARFLLTDKKVAAMFERTDMNHQFGMLRESLHELKKFSITQEKTEYIVNLARIHGARGRQVIPRFYTNWLNALIEAVHEIDPEATSEVEVAWRVMLAPGIAFMKSDPE
jgi:hemoglobin-like flavoprotein